MPGDMSSQRRNWLNVAKGWARRNGCDNRKAKAFAEYYNKQWTGEESPPIPEVWKKWPDKP